MLVLPPPCRQIDSPTMYVFQQAILRCGWVYLSAWRNLNFVLKLYVRDVIIVLASDTLTIDGQDVASVGWVGRKTSRFKNNFIFNFRFCWNKYHEDIICDEINVNGYKVWMDAPRVTNDCYQQVGGTHERKKDNIIYTMRIEMPNLTFGQFVISHKS